MKNTDLKIHIDVTEAEIREMLKTIEPRIKFLPAQIQTNLGHLAAQMNIENATTIVIPYQVFFLLIQCRVFLKQPEDTRFPGLGKMTVYATPQLFSTYIRKSSAEIDRLQKAQLLYEQHVDDEVSKTKYLKRRLKEASRNFYISSGVFVVGLLLAFVW